MFILYPFSIFPFYRMILGEFSNLVPPEKIGEVYGILMGIG
jgi:hypothetical protein